MKKSGAMMKLRERWGILRWRPVIVVAAVVVAGGCETPSAHTISGNYGLRGDMPIDPPGAPPTAQDDCVNGGRLFQLYCGSCHNARPMAERPFSNYYVAVAHMRDQAYLTGKEYRQIIMFLRRWHDIGPPTPPAEPSPKRFVFSQPISELRVESPTGASATPPPTGASPWRQVGAAGVTTPPSHPGPAEASSPSSPQPPPLLPAPIE